MADEFAKKFAENVLAVYGFGGAFILVAFVLIAWKLITEEAPDWIKGVSLVAVILGASLILGTFVAVDQVTHLCQKGQITQNKCLEDYHLDLSDILPTPRISLGP